jgi:hypothetical protein
MTEPLRVVEKSDQVAEAALPPAASVPAREAVAVALRYPIEAHGEPVTVLTLRPLTTREMMGHDLPFQANGRIDTEAAAYYLSLLAGIPRSSVLRLDPGDFMAAVNGMARFFVQPDLTS